jgi:uncharacterized protein (DUF302 family)
MSGNPAEVVTKVSPRSVEETIARLTAIVADRGLTLFAIIDHSGAAEHVDLDLRDTKLIVFGSPVAGTPVMQAAPLAALDLPLKVLVWSNDGQTNVSYTSTNALAARYDLSEDLADRLRAIDGITDAVVNR